jgi:hypothetical protein
LDAILLYLGTALLLLWAWSRYVQPVTRGSAIALFILPMCLTGRALFTGRIYAPVDVPYLAPPLRALLPKVGITVHNGYLSDVFMVMIPGQQAVRAAWHSGAWPLLNPFILCGQVLAGSFQPAPYDPFNVLGLLIPLPGALTYAATMTFFLATLGTFAFSRALGLREEAALIGAAAWMFCAEMLFFVGWTMGRTWAFLPFVLLGVRSVVHVPSLRSALFLTIAFVLLILAGHPETVLHVCGIAAVYGLFELDALRRNTGRAIAFATASGAVALLLTAFALLPLLEAAPQTKEYADRLLTRDMPVGWAQEFVNRAIGNSFLPAWGGQPWRRINADHYTVLNWRVGSLACVLALSALVWARRRRETWFFLAAAIVCAMAGANAQPVIRILHAIPLFDVTLNERLTFGAAFAIAILAAIGADAWPESVRRRIPAVLVVIAAALAMLVFERDRFVAAEIVTLAVFAVLLMTRAPARIALPIVLGLVLLQRSAVDGDMYPSVPRAAFYPHVPILDAIPRGAREPYRMAGVGFTLLPNGATMYGLEDARGYDAMNFKRLYDTFPLWSTPQVSSFNVILDPTRPFLRFLNIRWLINEADKLVEVPDALPRAFIPQHIFLLPSALPSMLSATDFRTQAWIEVPEDGPVDFDNARGTVTTTRVPNGLNLDVTMQGAGWVVISETGWKGWRAYIDRRRVQWRFANHAFLGVYVPAGFHHVKLRYLPEGFVRGRAISLATLAILIAAAVVQRRRSASRRTVPRSPPAE